MYVYCVEYNNVKASAKTHSIAEPNVGRSNPVRAESAASAY